MRAFYSLLYYITLPFILIYHLWYRYKDKQHQLRLRERFACFTPPKQVGGIWVHASSVGEVNASLSLIKSLEQHYPNYPITITTQTLTGSQCVRMLFGDRVFHVLAPFDLPDCVNRFLNRIQPRISVIMETELWPNTSALCKQRSIPMLLANARISLRSMQRYAYIKNFCRKMLSSFRYILTQSVEDSQRFTSMGVPRDKIKYVGNIKYTFQISDEMRQKVKHFAQYIRNDKLVWIAASTHEGEEEIVLQAFKKVRQNCPNALLILVPRHPNRSKAVMELCLQQQWNSIYRSHVERQNDFDIVVVDTIGDCPFLYGVADVAFVGGSLVPVGGHNLIEPAAWGLPILSGPYTHNFAAIEAEFKQAGLIESVSNAEQLAENVLKYLKDPQLRQHHALRASELIDEQQRALEKHIAIIQEVVGEQACKDPS